MRVIAILLTCFALAGCASATRGWTEQISIASSPSGARATVTGSENHTCVTPCAIQVNRNSDLQVTFEMTGFEPELVVLTKEIATTGAAGFAGNILLGGIIGMGVDAVSGAPLDHKPNPVMVTLRPLARPAEPLGRQRPKRGSPTS
ncbi:MAG: translation initiation factor 2 [Rhizobiales bacterium]|nr:translation initiation factor 2 [Hyphomicrobiales bacterium]